MVRTPENLLVGITGALGTKESHFVSKKCVLRKFCGVCQKWWILELSNLCHCVQHPWKLTSRHYWSSRHERQPLCQQKYILRKCCGVSQKQCMLELSNLCHCVQHPWKVIGRNFMSYWHERKPVCQQKCVLRKFCGVCQKWWMLELSNLCHFVQHPCKVSSGDFWRSMNKRSHSGSKNVFWENSVGYVRNGEC